MEHDDFDDLNFDPVVVFENINKTDINEVHDNLELNQNKKCSCFAHIDNNKIIQQCICTFCKKQICTACVFIHMLKECTNAIIEKNNYKSLLRCKKYINMKIYFYTNINESAVKKRKYIRRLITINDKIKYCTHKSH
jgi:hypothetical protein